MHAKQRVSLAALFSLLVVLVMAEATLAAPAARICNGTDAYITYPASGSTVGGTFSIIGTAFLPNNEFRYFKLEYSAAGTNDWFVIVNGARAQVRDGVLATVNTTRLTEGDYALRVLAVDSTGNYCEGIVSPIHIGRRPDAPPTPMQRVSNTPAPFVTPPPTLIPSTLVPGTPTVVIDLRRDSTGSGVTLARAGEPITPPGQPVGLNAVGSLVGDLLGQFGQMLVFGAQLTAGAFLLIGIVAFLRNNL